MKIEEELALVMTASVDPKGMPAAASLPDPRRREEDYVNSLTYYLREHPRIRRIVFAENSGWPLDRLKQVAAENNALDRVEFLSFALNDFPREYGKGYGEMLLLDNVFAQSRFIAASRYTAKVTGRIFLINLTRMLERAPLPLEFYSDLRDHPFYDWFKPGWSGHHGETRFFITTPAFYDANLRGKYAGLYEERGIMMENLIFDVVKAQLRAHNPRVIARYRSEPEFRGIAGHGGKNYGSGREKQKRLIRGVMRKVMPWLWI